MKRVLLASVLAVALLSLTAFAGFYAEITTDPMEPVIALEVGLGTLATFSGEPGVGLGFDIYGQVENILGYPADNLWACGFNVAIIGTEITLDLGMDFGFDQTHWSNYLTLDQWDTTATITGHPGDITTVWGEVVLTYASETLKPTFELGVRVEIP